METQMSQNTTQSRSIEIKGLLNKIQPQSGKFTGLYFNISKLMPYNRQPHQISQIKKQVNSIFSALKAQCFFLKNEDLVCIFEKTSMIMVERAISQFKRMIGSDPIIAHSHNRENFAIVYDLGSKWREFCVAISEIEDNPLFNIRNKSSNGDGSSSPLLIDGIKVETLSLIERTLKHSDMTSHIRRQSIYYYNEIEPPKVLGHHFFVSMHDFQNTLQISESITGNAWLFRQITFYLDHQIIKSLSALMQQKKSHLPIHLNLNLRSLVTPHFSEFIKNYGVERPLFLFFDLIDVAAHPDVFSYGVELLKPKNITIGINNISTKHMEFINFNSLNADLFKINYNEDINKCPDFLKNFVESVGKEKVILHRCDSLAHIKAGLAIGISQFQGMGVEELGKSTQTT